ncbi:UNVERIFIED_CONTAM: Endoglucanase 13 [Sesamum radiatum]|uniref:cellulase n=1 Tax=Sesamum radiatum TaxID=300843 RepID=A0AAW2KAJ5_SESRA
MSYMVGVGSNYPKRVHHRGASIVSIMIDATPVTCKAGFDEWFHRDADNPKILAGSIRGPESGRRVIRYEGQLPASGGRYCKQCTLCWGFSPTCLKISCNPSKVSFILNHNINY